MAYRRRRTSALRALGRTAAATAAVPAVLTNSLRRKRFGSDMVRVLRVCVGLTRALRGRVGRLLQVLCQPELLLADAFDGERGHKLGAARREVRVVVDALRVVGVLARGEL